MYVFGGSHSSKFSFFVLFTMIAILSLQIVWKFFQSECRERNEGNNVHLSIYFKDVKNEAPYLY